MAESNCRRAPGDYISLPSNAAAHVDTYFEYRVFSEYKTDFAEIPTQRPILISCRCVLFQYVANASGTSDPNYRYKYSRDTHGTRPPYTYCNCTGFRAPFTCTCGESACKHITLVETKQEREERGHPTGYGTPYKAMGRPDDDFLNQLITAMDHAILRAYVFLDPNSTEAQSHLSCGIRASRNPNDTNAQLATGIRNNISSLH
ncbi:unnamed protein product [Adineta steineri]|uniref:Protein FAM221A n=1 Tax=Adineta steineri TaxID=433720 RepID=A0A819AXV8_9BILA|nr:unnamed protein product [Adineta steineri]CAF3792339.1 unnamed protein product [Adineta steineri]